MLPHLTITLPGSAFDLPPDPRRSAERLSRPNRQVATAAHNRCRQQGLSQKSQTAKTKGPSITHLPIQKLFRILGLWELLLWPLRTTIRQRITVNLSVMNNNWQLGFLNISHDIVAYNSNVTSIPNQTRNWQKYKLIQNWRPGSPFTYP